MPFKINHIHIKSPDPRTTAEWYEKAFGFKIVSDETRVFGDRFIRCQQRRRHAGEHLQRAQRRDAGRRRPRRAHWGLEHFAIECDDIDADIARLDKLGAKLQEGPIKAPNGVRFAFLGAPDGARIELLELPKKPAG